MIPRTSVFGLMGTSCSKSESSFKIVIWGSAAKFMGELPAAVELFILWNFHRNFPPDPLFRDLSELAMADCCFKAFTNAFYLVGVLTAPNRQNTVEQ
jgi:hypothetical protein